MFLKFLSIGPSSKTVLSSVEPISTILSNATCPTPQGLTPQRRANATIVMLVRNSDLEGALNSVRQVEDRFNRRHGYPYVFLNDMAFTESFKTWAFFLFSIHLMNLLKTLAIWRRMTNIIANSSSVAFGVIPKEHWEQPSWIDEAKATSERNRLTSAGVKYGGTWGL